MHEGRRRDGLDEFNSVCGERAGGDEVFLEIGELRGRWFGAEEQQVGDVLERRVLREIRNAVAAIEQASLLDGTDGAVAGGDAFQAFFRFNGRSAHSSSPAIKKVDYSWRVGLG